jgi:hypothetical protein
MGGQWVDLAQLRAQFVQVLRTQQRFGDRAATHPQHRRQLDLAQRRTGCVDTGVDRFSHAVSDLIGHPASALFSYSYGQVACSAE